MAEDRDKQSTGETVSADDLPDVAAPAASRAAEQPMDPDAVEPYSGTEPEPGPADPLEE